MTTPDDATSTTDDAELALTAETLSDLDPAGHSGEVAGGNRVTQSPGKPGC